MIFIITLYHHPSISQVSSFNTVLDGLASAGTQIGEGLGAPSSGGTSDGGEVSVDASLLGRVGNRNFTRQKTDISATVLGNFK